MSALTTEEVVRRLGRQPGYRLITFRDVGLPFWDLPLRCRLLETKPLGTIDEFILKSIAAGLRSAAEITQFLGLSERISEGVLGGLVASGHVAARHDTEASSVSFALTEKGERALTEAGEIVPQERELRLSYDGLLREFVAVPREMRWRPRDLQDNDVLKLPAFPADPPGVGPSDTAGVATALSETLRTARQNLLSVLGLSGKREQFFIRAVALVFEPTDASGDIVVRFAIDGRYSEAHDQAFARAEGHRKLGISQALRASRPDVGIVSADVMRAAAEETEAAALRLATDAVRTRLEQAERRVTQRERDEGVSVDSIELEELRKKLEEAERALASVPARLLEVQEHPELLRDALTTAQDRLLIVSPWIRAAVVDSAFLRQLEALLERGTWVGIGYGIDDKRPVNDRDEKAEEALRVLNSRYDNFEFVRLGDTHAKVLLVDARHVIVTSFNWLSFKGDARRPFRDERGTLVTIASEIDRIFEDYRERLGAGLADPSAGARAISGR